MLKKGLVCVILVLFVGISVVPMAGSSLSIEKHVSADNKMLYLQQDSNGKTLYVGGDGPGNYSKIQDAIDNASDGDTVFVYDDSSPYYGKVIVDKSINLIGEDKNTTVIDGDGGCQDCIVKIRADDVNIRCFTITNGGVGIRVREFNNCQISNSILSNNEEAGIYLEDSNSNTICNSTINSNNWCGALVWFSNNNMFINNVISKNKIYGIWLHGSSDNTTVSNNIFDDNKQAGMCISEYHRPFYKDIYPNNNTISNNIIKSNNEEGLYLGEASRNYIINNNISSNSWSGIVLSDSNNNIISGNTISNNHYQGISIQYSNRNEISRNNITNNKQHGVISYFSSDNIIYHNNFKNNIEGNAYGCEDLSYDLWYNATLKQGNYWDDYDGIDILPPYGIGDIPYNIPPGGLLYDKDRFPLMESWPGPYPYNNNQANQNSQSNSQQSTNPLILRFLEQFPLLERLLNLI